MPLLWLTEGVAIGFYFGFFGRALPLDTTQCIILNTIVGLLAFIQILLTVYCMTCNVEDDVVTKAKKQRNRDYVKRSGVPVIDPSTMFCNICQVHVKPLTKHCKTCNKCVEGYDHQ